MKINTSKQGQEANTIRFNETTPLAQPQQPVLQPQTQPTQTLPSTPTQQVQPVQQVIHNHYSKFKVRGTIRLWSNWKFYLEVIYMYWMFAFNSFYRDRCLCSVDTLLIYPYMILQCKFYGL
jgi:hypothetical protein